MIVTHSGEHVGESPELVRIEVMKRSPNFVIMRVTILSLFVSPNMVIFGGSVGIGGLRLFFLEKHVFVKHPNDHRYWIYGSVFEHFFVSDFF